MTECGCAWCIAGGIVAVAVWAAAFKVWFAFIREMDAGRPQRGKR